MIWGIPVNTHAHVFFRVYKKHRGGQRKRTFLALSAGSRVRNKGSSWMLTTSHTIRSANVGTTVSLPTWIPGMRFAL